jgi:hypothetical protein
MSLSHTHRQLGRGQLLPRLALTSGGVKPLSTSSRLFARKDPGDPCSDGTALCGDTCYPDNGECCLTDEYVVFSSLILTENDSVNIYYF